MNSQQHRRKLGVLRLGDNRQRSCYRADVLQKESVPTVLSCSSHQHVKRANIRHGDKLNIEKAHHDHYSQCEWSTLQIH